MEPPIVLWPKGQGKGGQLLTILVILIARRSGGWPLILDSHPFSSPRTPSEEQCSTKERDSLESEAF
jgi:hypothetical protein